MEFTNSSHPHILFWFRRDLRIEDNKGLYYALNQKQPVVPLFIFDTDITDSLPANDTRITFIYQSLRHIQGQLTSKGRSLLVMKGKPVEIIRELLKKYNIQSVYTNKDHEPYGIRRDEQIEQLLGEHHISMHAYLDHLLFEKNEVLKSDGSPYHVFTPYSRRCLKTLQTQKHMQAFPSEKLIHQMAQPLNAVMPSLQELGFKNTSVDFPDPKAYSEVIGRYHQTRDYPAINGTTRLGVHLRFGTQSIRNVAMKAFAQNDTFFNELLWREFYAMILWHYPRVVSRSFKKAYDHIPWRNDLDEFERWKNGETGYPMVDAGMRQLLSTGYMHNRVRMIVASFLTKHLLIDWRWGEAWFAKHLLDFELSSNNGGWQWCAGSGCDAAPYFRIFNPAEQQKKYDPNDQFVKKWIPELHTPTYPAEIVDHKQARERCLQTYKTALDKQK